MDIEEIRADYQARLQSLEFKTVWGSYMGALSSLRELGSLLDKRFGYADDEHGDQIALRFPWTKFKIKKTKKKLIDKVRAYNEQLAGLITSITLPRPLFPINTISVTGTSFDSNRKKVIEISDLTEMDDKYCEGVVSDRSEVTRYNFTLVSTSQAPFFKEAQEGFGRCAFCNEETPRRDLTLPEGEFIWGLGVTAQVDLYYCHSDSCADTLRGYVIRDIEKTRAFTEIEAEFNAAILSDYLGRNISKGQLPVVLNHMEEETHRLLMKVISPDNQE